MMRSYKDTDIFDRFDPEDQTLKYKFEIYQYGYMTDVRYFNTYESAQKFFLRQYFIYECGEKLFINDEPVSFLEAYQFFNASILNQKAWGKRLDPTRY